MQTSITNQPTDPVPQVIRIPAIGSPVTTISIVWAPEDFCKKMEMCMCMCVLCMCVLCALTT